MALALHLLIQVHMKHTAQKQVAAAKKALPLPPNGDRLKYNVQNETGELSLKQNTDLATAKYWASYLGAGRKVVAILSTGTRVVLS